MHLHSIEVALQGGPVPPRFISIKWGGTSAPPEFTGGLILYILYIFIYTVYTFQYLSIYIIWYSIADGYMPAYMNSIEDNRHHTRTVTHTFV